MSKIYKKNCTKCGKYYEGRGKSFCSWECRFNGKPCPRYWLGKKLPKEAINKIKKARESQIEPWLGKTRDEKTKEKIKEKVRDLWKSEEYKNHMILVHKGQKSSPETEFKKGSTPWNKGKENPFCKGDKNIFWKGGITKTSYKERIAICTSSEYRRVRKKILERDDYTCQICGRRGGDICVDHVKSFHNFPELRMDENNLRVLCVTCHKKTDNYGTKVYKEHRDEMAKEAYTMFTQRVDFAQEALAIQTFLEELV